METPLMIAVQRGHKNTITRLLKHGADPNKQSVYGKSCLHMAIELCNIEITELLLNGLRSRNQMNQTIHRVIIISNNYD
jgi:ankyrin repeat protein